MLKELRLGRLQHKVMELLWDRGSATADNIRAAPAYEYPLTDSTVRTVLRRPEEKNTRTTV
jgi:predicted transcriptional regulator